MNPTGFIESDSLYSKSCFANPLRFIQRLVIVPPELAYGKKGVQEIPPNATIEVINSISSSSSFAGSYNGVYLMDLSFAARH